MITYSWFSFFLLCGLLSTSIWLAYIYYKNVIYKMDEFIGKMDFKK